MRIVWSMWFLSGYYGRYIPPAAARRSTSTRAVEDKGNDDIFARFANVPWQNIIPTPTVLAAFGAAYVLTAATEQYIGWDRLYNKFAHLSVGVAAFAVVMGVVYMSEKQFLMDIQGIVRQRRR